MTKNRLTHVLCAGTLLIGALFLAGCPTSAPPAELVDEWVAQPDAAGGDALQDDARLPSDGVSPDMKDLAVCEPDCEGKVCGDDGCQGSCGQCDNGLTCNKVGQCIVSQSICGDNVCDGPETADNCPPDCGIAPPKCGDGVCDADESTQTCPDDCPNVGPMCGDGMCQQGETPMSCPEDCTNAQPVCGNGVCEQGEPFACPQDCENTEPVCGNGVCEQGEPFACPQDCENTEPVCGNGVCEQGEHFNCPEDCPVPVCGDGVCDMGEFMECPEDCQDPSDCGDGVCGMGENFTNCPDDCQNTGPAPCESDADCTSQDTCPVGSSLGCKCATIMGGATGCVPMCQNDSDCPSLNGVLMHCTWQGLCKPGM